MYYQSMQLVVLGLVLLSTFGRLVLNMFGPRTVNHPNCSGPNLILQSQECGYLFPPFLEYGYHVGTHTHIYIYMYIYIYTYQHNISLCVYVCVSIPKDILLSYAVCDAATRLVKVEVDLLPPLEEPPSRRF